MGRLQTSDSDSATSNTSKTKKRYWSFPEFKEISTAVLKSQRFNIDGSEVSPMRGVPNDSKSAREAKINNESMLEYVNFPDPQLYLIGFQINRLEEESNKSYHHTRKQTSMTSADHQSNINTDLYDQ